TSGRIAQRFRSELSPRPTLAAKPTEPPRTGRRIFPEELTSRPRPYGSVTNIVGWIWNVSPISMSFPNAKPTGRAIANRWLVFAHWGPKPRTLTPPDSPDPPGGPTRV